MKMGENFVYTDSHKGRYEIVFCFKSKNDNYDGGINHTPLKGKKECYFFTRKNDNLKVYSISGCDRTLSRFPDALIKKILDSYN